MTIAKCVCGGQPVFHRYKTGQGAVKPEYARIQCACGLHTSFCSTDCRDLETHLRIEWSKLQKKNGRVI